MPRNCWIQHPNPNKGASYPMRSYVFSTLGPHTGAPLVVEGEGSVCAWSPHLELMSSQLFLNLLCEGMCQMGCRQLRICGRNNCPLKGCMQLFEVTKTTHKASSLMVTFIQLTKTEAQGHVTSDAGPPPFTQHSKAPRSATWLKLGYLPPQHFLSLCLLFGAFRWVLMP